jgi:hypothetical protein
MFDADLRDATPIDGASWKARRRRESIEDDAIHERARIALGVDEAA